MADKLMEKNNGEVLTQRTGLRIMSSTDRIRQLIRHEMFRANEDKDHESFEDADDFDLDDNEEWVSPYEELFEPDSSSSDDQPVSAGRSDALGAGPAEPASSPDASAPAHVVDGGASSGP